MASFVTNRKTRAVLVTSSMEVSFDAGSGLIEKIQALGNANESSSLHHLSTGDVGPTSVVTGSVSPLLNVTIPNGSVIDGPLNEIRVEAGTFLVFYKGEPSITQA